MVVGVLFHFISKCTWYYMNTHAVTKATPRHLLICYTIHFCEKHNLPLWQLSILLVSFMHLLALPTIRFDVACYFSSSQRFLVRKTACLGHFISVRYTIQTKRTSIAHTYTANDIYLLRKKVTNRYPIPTHSFTYDNFTHSNGIQFEEFELSAQYAMCYIKFRLKFEINTQNGKIKIIFFHTYISVFVNLAYTYTCIQTSWINTCYSSVHIQVISFLCTYWLVWLQYSYTTKTNFIKNRNLQI